MEKNPVVSVIVPCYNHGKYLSEALFSIKNQTYENWECIIVNDGSPDNTEEIANHWINLDKRFKYFNKENGGLSSARNAGIEKSNGNYILTLDADDKFECKFIEKAVSILDKNEKVGIVTCWGYRFIKKEIYGLFKPVGGTIENYLFCSASLASSMFRRECWEQVGGYDEEMKKGYEDWDYYIRIALNGWQTHVIEEPLFFYRQHQVSMRTIAQNQYDIDIKMYLYNKHKKLYKDNFIKTVGHLLRLAEKNKQNELKRLDSLEYKIGKIILKPLRFIKSLFK